MRKILLLIIGLSTLPVSNTHASSLQEEGYRIKLQFKGVDDQEGYLGYHYGAKKYVTDTCALQGEGIYEFEGDKPLRAGMYFLYTKNFYFEFVIHGEQNFTIRSAKEKLYQDAKITNSPENEAFFQFQNLMVDNNSLSKKLRNELKDASTEEDSTNIRKKLVELDQDVLKMRREFRENHQGTFVSKILGLMDPPELPDFEEVEDETELYKKRFFYIKEHFFDGIDIGDSSLMRTPGLYEKKVMDFVEKRNVQHPDTLINVVDFILDQVKDSRELYNFWLTKLADKFQRHSIMGMDKVFIHIAKNYYVNSKPGFPEADWITEETMKQLKEEIEYTEPNLIGNVGKEVYAQDTLGKTYSSHRSFLNEYIVLFFYDPGCSHCKKKAPVMHEAYKNLRKDNLDMEFLAISTITDENKWKSYIKEKQYTWMNLADIDLRSNFRRDYNVRTVPQIYVLDKDRKIVAKKLDAEQIEQFVRDRFKLEELKSKEHGG